MGARQRKMITVLLSFVALGVAGFFVSADQSIAPPKQDVSTQPTDTSQVEGASTQLASTALSQLEIKGRAPKTDYAREQFGAGWADVDECDMRQFILARDLEPEVFDADGCTVLSGTLNDPYTGEIIQFRRGTSSSAKVQIDHVVALSDAWQKGAQSLDVSVRAEFANDPLNLLAVDGPTNNQKSDSDAASWLPPNKDYRCRYVARQIAVKQKYQLWVTQAEHDAMTGVLGVCPDQKTPQVQ